VRACSRLCITVCAVVPRRPQLFVSTRLGQCVHCLKQRLQVVLFVSCSVGRAHRNPLHALAGCARFIMETCEPDDENYEDMCTILSSASQMSNLITAMVDWTGVNSSYCDTPSEAVNVMDAIKELVRGVLHLLRPVVPVSSTHCLL
jgi:hypothetical protein